MWLSLLARWRLLRHLDTVRVEQAISRAEAATSGEIRVSVAGVFRGDIREFAEEAFQRLGMAATRHRNGVLVLIAPTRRQLVILGDQGIHARVGDAFWSDLAAELSAYFGREDFTAGLVSTIERIGAELARHFPPEPDRDINELPNTVDVPGGTRPSYPKRT